MCLSHLPLPGVPVYCQTAAHCQTTFWCFAIFPCPHQSGLVTGRQWYHGNINRFTFIWKQHKGRIQSKKKNGLEISKPGSEHQNIIFVGSWLDNMLMWPHLHHTAPHALHSAVKYSFVQNRLKPTEKEGNQLLLARGPLYHLNMSLGVSTYLIPVSRTPDMHCQTSVRHNSGIPGLLLLLDGGEVSADLLERSLS